MRVDLDSEKAEILTRHSWPNLLGWWHKKEIVFA
jgi:hypothetical protein